MGIKGPHTAKKLGKPIGKNLNIHFIAKSNKHFVRNIILKHFGTIQLLAYYIPKHTSNTQNENLINIILKLKIFLKKKNIFPQ